MNNSIIRFFQLLRFGLIFWGVEWNSDSFKKDLNRWKEIKNLPYSGYLLTAIMLWDYKEFRNLFIYRHKKNPFFRYYLRAIYPPLDSLFLESKTIGGGLFIQHGFSTMLAAESVGENCWINQQVTVGFRDSTQAPTIGNNVMITCGAKVLGAIIVGDNAVIGANAVVVKDVEPGAVMVGIPAKRVK